MRQILMVITFILILTAMWLSLTIARIEGPPANPESAVRNILYAHVPSSICALLCFLLLLVVSIGYLCNSKSSWDIVAQSAAEVGTVFAIVLNASGSIFSRAEWGPWWTASPRLMTAAILLFLYLVYLILRSSLPGSKHRRARICAVFAIIASLDVPMVIISARFMPDIHKPSFSLTSSYQTATFMLSMVATIMLGVVLIWLRTDILKTKDQLEKKLEL
jgi:heme exporter protein C